MKRYKGNIKRTVTLLLVITAAIFTLFGCESGNPLAPSATDGGLINQDIQPIFLKPNVLKLNKSFSVQQYISASKGGRIVVGDEDSGYSELIFSPGDLSRDTWITFNWDSENFSTDLQPHGLVFNGPVELNLSYKDANLSDINEDNLKIWYYHPIELTPSFSLTSTVSSETITVYGVWELIGGTVEVSQKRVKTTIQHFSRYAIGEIS
jgi:hypothetical protein